MRVNVNYDTATQVGIGIAIGTVFLIWYTAERVENNNEALREIRENQHYIAAKVEGVEDTDA